VLLTSLAESGTGYTQTRAYETNRDLLNQFTTQFSSTTKTRYDYTFNTLGQRVTAKQSGDAYADLGVPSFYNYTYNSRSEVTAATGFLCVSGSVTNYTLPMPGRAYQFAYDTAGNRTSATSTTNGALMDYFTPNSLNQYTSRDNHSLTVSGTLDSSAKILVNGVLADRQGAYWSADTLLSNGSGPAYNGSIALKAGKTGSPDLKRTSTVAGYLAPATENGTYISYDADGNLTSDGRWLYTWDAENRLTSMQTTTASISAGLPGKKQEFRYDSTGRRTSKKVSTWSGSAWTASTDVRFVYQGWNLVAELDANNSLSRIRTYAWGLDLAGSLSATGGIGALVQFVDHTGTATAYLPGYDGSGNVVALMQSSGAIAATYEYGPFGELLRKDGTYAAANPIRNATKYTDDESGYVNYGTRYYDPRNGRFISRDTIGEAGGLNLYAFCGNNGVNGYDVLGQDDFMDTSTWQSIGLSGYDKYLASRPTVAQGTEHQHTPTGVEAHAIAMAQQNALVAAVNASAGAGLSSLASTMADSFAASTSASIMAGLNAFAASSYSNASSQLAATNYASVTAGNNNLAAANLAASAGSVAAGLANLALAANGSVAPNNTATSNGGANTGPTTQTSGYWDRYGQHVDTYAITLLKSWVAGLITLGTMPKSWVWWTGGRGPALGSANEITSVLRGTLGSNAVTTSATFQGLVGGAAIIGAGIGGYNFGVLLSGFVYAAFPGSNGLPPPPPPPPSPSPHT